jgi:hypothetical protein
VCGLGGGGRMVVRADKAHKKEADKNRKSGQKQDTFGLPPVFSVPVAAFIAAI